MRRFIFILVILLASAWLGIKIAADPGYALFAYRYWTVEMPLWFFVLAFIVLLFVLYSLLRFFDSIDLSFYRFKNWLRWRRKNKSYNKTNRGLLELIEAHWRSAEAYLLEGVARSDAPLINFLGAAKAAQEQGAYDRRDHYLQKAHDVAPRAEIPIGLSQANLQMEQGQLEQALATLKHLYTIAPKHKLILKRLQKIYLLLSDWSALLTLLPRLKKSKIMNADELESLEQTAYQGLLLATAKSSSVQAVNDVWNKIPKKIQKQPLVVECYVECVWQEIALADAVEKLIQEVLKKTWNTSLMELYGLLTTSDLQKQLLHAESYLKKYSNQATLFLTLGRLCVRCQLWGKARYYFEESLKLQMNTKASIDYGKLLEQLGETSHALKVYRDGLSLG